MNQMLFDFFANHHEISLTQSEYNDIEHIVNENAHREKAELLNKNTELQAERDRKQRLIDRAVEWIEKQKIYNRELLCWEDACGKREILVELKSELK